jgi:hypothetical protein
MYSLLDAHASLYLLVPGRLSVRLAACLSQLALSKDDINTTYVVMVFEEEEKTNICAVEAPPPKTSSADSSTFGVVKV